MFQAKALRTRSEDRGAPLRVLQRLRRNGVLPARPSIRQITITWLGTFIVIAVVASVTTASHIPLVLGSFGASCVILFGFPEAPFAQPRNVIGGHFLTSFVGLVFFALMGATWWSMALAVATAIALMQTTRTVHPPAGSNPVIVMLSAPPWSFLLTPTLAGACALVAIALIYNNITNRHIYPQYWL